MLDNYLILLDINKKVDYKMNIKRIAILVFLIASISMGSAVFMINAEVDTANSSNPELNAVTLTIVTRHDTTLTNAFQAAFLATPEAIALGVTSFDFRQASTDAGWKKLLEDPSKSVDLAWGGGPALFNTMDNWGLLKHIDPVTDAALFTAINDSVPAELAGASMKSFAPNGSLVWAANAISSFGFTVNHDFLTTHALPVPKTWEELASPIYYISPSVKAISMGDPPLTTSNTRIYQIILQAFGWDVGWSILTRMGANSGMYPGSVATRAAVVSGEVGIAMTIDFYGIIAMGENLDCEYIIPQGQSIVNGDPIAMGINVDDYDAAAAFLTYVNTPEGQAIWLTEGIDRLPVNEDAFHTPDGQLRPDLYLLFNETLDNVGIDFDEDLATSNLATTIYYFHNTIEQLHTLLRNTWGEMVTQLRDGEINSTFFNELIEDLGVPGMTLQESIDWNTQYQLNATFSAIKDGEWRNFAQTKYNTILGILIPETETTNAFGMIPVFITSIFVATMVLLRRKKK
ncbi:MAG: ABC transporter substrate-binding protein [Candidatus Heimdallarchaeota archaeon]|nr:ABC transporter substrate-binding protein [Candidatus Heimdallarchaeota archaeon]MCG3257108.1 ABC transporter substrate-binding protein [Candidatus Heimdallarchaeota archaeon]MCK4612168.1 ABC transporter substrate-binding protein [Candidatus Heimdallarchaeota archaeon]